MEWYYAKDGNQQGPITMAQLRQLASSGKLEPSDMVFKTGTKDWVEASTVAGLFPAARSAPAAPAPAEGGFAFGEEKGAVAPARRKGARARVEKQEDDEETPRPHIKRASGGGGSMGELFAFRRMVAPTLIIILFWIGVVVSVLYGLGMTFSGFAMSGMAMIIFLLGGLLSIPISILMLRLYCELVIVIFRMNETLTDIKNLLERQRDS